MDLDGLSITVFAQYHVEKCRNGGHVWGYTGETIFSLSWIIPLPVFTVYQLEIKDYLSEFTNMVLAQLLDLIAMCTMASYADAKSCI